MNNLFNEDYIETLKRKDINFDYVFTVPPDFDELGWNPKKDMNKYIDTLYKLLYALQLRCKVITVAITDRKFDRGIVPKHTWITNIMIQGFDYKLISHKIWHKSSKLNLFRLNYTHILTFGKGNIKQNHTKEYEYDIYTDNSDAYKGFKYSIPVAVVEKLINNFTQKSDVVYDPFTGSGTTPISAIKTGRRYLGSEIYKDYYNLARQRIMELEITKHKWW